MTASETEDPATEETEHHGDTRLSKSSVEAMMVTKEMLGEKEVEDKDCRVRIQLMQAEVEFRSEKRAMMVGDNTHTLKGAGDA